jgi:hypothetical protein
VTSVAALPRRTERVTPEALEAWRADRDEIARIVFAPRSTLTLSQWADENRVLSGTWASRGPGARAGAVHATADGRDHGSARARSLAFESRRASARRRRSCSTRSATTSTRSRRRSSSRSRRSTTRGSFPRSSSSRCSTTPLPRSSASSRSNRSAGGRRFSRRPSLAARCRSSAPSPRARCAWCTAA